MDWPEGTLLWRVGIWFLLAVGVGYLNHRLVMGAMERAAADAKKGASKIMPWYLVRSASNFVMMLLAFFIDGHTYVLLAVLAGLLVMTIVLAVSRMRALP